MLVKFINIFSIHCVKMSENNISWLCVKKNIEKRSILEKLLPDEYKKKFQASR